MWLKQNMSCCSINLFDFAPENYIRAEALVHFSRAKSNELTEQQDMFLLQSEFQSGFKSVIKW